MFRSSHERTFRRVRSLYPSTAHCTEIGRGRDHLRLGDFLAVEEVSVDRRSEGGCSNEIGELLNLCENAGNVHANGLTRL